MIYPTSTRSIKSPYYNLDQLNNSLLWLSCPYHAQGSNRVCFYFVMQMDDKVTQDRVQLPARPFARLSLAQSIWELGRVKWPI